MTGPEERRPRQRVADRELLGLLDQQPDELVVDGLLDVDPAVGRALLPAEPEGRPHDPLGRLLEVRRAQDDRRVLAAHLDDARPREPGGEVAEQLEPDLVRAREHDPVDALVVLQLVADGVARAHDEVEHAVGNPGVAIGLEHRDRGHRAGRGRLEDRRVAGHHRGARRADRQRHREVERADHGEHPVGSQDRPGVDRRVAKVVQRVVVERVVLGRLGVVADEVGRLLDLAQRLEPRLADLDGHQARVLHLALGDQLRGPLHDLESLLPPEPEPGRLRPAGGLDGVPHIGTRAAGERSDQDVAVDR